MRRRSAPSLSMWVAKVWRSVCGVTRRLVPTRRACLADDPVDTARGEPPAAGIGEERTAVAAPHRQIAIDGREGHVADRHNSFLVALAEDAHGAVTPVEVGAIEPTAFRDADARGIEQLEQRVVAASGDRRIGGTVEQVLRLVLGQKRRQAPRRSWAPHLPRGVLLDHAAAREEAQAAPDARELAADAALGEPALVKRGEVGAHHARIDSRGDRIPGPAEKGSEVAQVAGVAAHRVGRGAALDGQVLEEGGDGGVHHAPVTPRPSGRSPACIRTPRGCTRA